MTPSGARDATSNPELLTIPPSHAHPTEGAETAEISWKCRDWAHNPKVAGSNPAPATSTYALSVKASRRISRQGFSLPRQQKVTGG